ncbi:hypothetical protein Lbir_1742 [Legionella birminghamensis]|uniref:Uncharacterized protein n=1 Tax=Legionella birminghamensis TaxID=28083 RepID=A0A378JSK3_9GAMM|nr:hypothetical protein [Legionella birminghamensis]KTC71404.1 hypothetical protein Lbir_1742 [Legionella birminghamensis]STX60970.1 Uncharacterised protein [Legionella birminghamensis]
MSSASQVISCFKKVLTAGEDLRHHLISLDTNAVWINTPLTRDFINDSSHLAAAILDFYPLIDNNPQSTSAYQGAIGGTQATLRLAETFNSAKDLFCLAARAYMKEQKQRETVIIHDLLRNAGFPPIKLRQVYRHVPIVNFHPRLISFCMLRHNSKIKISQLEAQERLAKAGKGLHIDVQLNKLRQQDNLVIHRETASIWAANISTFKEISNRVTTHKILTSLPIIYPHDTRYPFPQVKYSESRARNARRDKCMEDDVFLKSIHAYRYVK